jgi:hypothetical protein
MTLLSKPLKYVMKAYEYELGVLHPFEATLADLTVRARVKQGCMTLDEVRARGGRWGKGRERENPSPLSDVLGADVWWGLCGLWCRRTRLLGD